MKINFCFEGWINGANVETVTETATGKKIKVDSLPKETVIKKLESGEFSISLGDFLYKNNSNSSIEMYDFANDEI